MKAESQAESPAELLAVRYGRKVVDAKRTRRRIIALAAALVALFLVWAVWVTSGTVNQVKHQVLGYEVISETQTSVRFSVQSPAGPAICAIQVLNQSYAIVGYTQMPVDSSGEYQTLVNTTELGTSGLVDKCWLK